MHIEHKILLSQRIHHIVKLLAQSVGEKYRRLNKPLAIARRTRFKGLDVERRTHSLTSDLHQPELAQRQDVVACAVVGHHLSHMVVELLAMLGGVHINEVDYYYATHISQPQLASYFVGGTKIDIDSIFLLILCILIAVARIDVYHMEGFSMLDNNVSSRLKRHCLTKRRLYLLRHIK